MSRRNPSPASGGSFQRLVLISPTAISNDRHNHRLWCGRPACPARECRRDARTTMVPTAGRTFLARRRSPGDNPGVLPRGFPRTTEAAALPNDRTGIVPPLPSAARPAAGPPALPQVAQAAQLAQPAAAPANGRTVAAAADEEIPLVRK